MSDIPEKDHWDLLVSKLGATPPPREAALAAPADAEAEATSEESEPKPEETEPLFESVCKPKPPPQQRTAADWRQLGATLGIAPQEPIVVSPPTLPMAPSPSAHFERAGEATPGGPALAADLAGEAGGAPVWVDTTMDAEQPAPLAPGEPGFIAAEPTRTGRPARDEEYRGGERSRRKRRGRRRGGKRFERDEPGEEGAAALDLGPGQPDATDVEVSRQASADETLPGVESAADEEQSGPARSKRRRRRRGASRSREEPARDSPRQDSADQVATEGLPAARGPSDAAPDEVDEDLADLTLPAEGTEPASKEGAYDSSDEEEAAKAIHRGIPTWDEAVGIVIAANMESRAKKPNAGHRHRGHWGSRESRGDKSR